MKPEEYIEKLRQARMILDLAKDELEKAAEKMQRRLETGYTSMESASFVAAIKAREHIMEADSTLKGVGITDIEY